VLFNNDEFTEDMIYSFCSRETLEQMIAENEGAGDFLLSTLAIVGVSTTDFLLEMRSITRRVSPILSINLGAGGVATGFRYPGLISQPSTPLREWHQGEAFFAD